MKKLLTIFAISAWPLPLMAVPTYLDCVLWPKYEYESGRKTPKNFRFTLNESSGTLSVSIARDVAGTAETISAAYNPREIVGIRRINGVIERVIYTINRVTGYASRQTKFKSGFNLLDEGYCNVVQAPSRKF